MTIGPAAAGRSAPTTPMPPLSRSLQLQLAAIHAEKAGRTPAQRKIDSNLLYAEKVARHATFPPHFPKLATGVRTDAAGRVAVDVHGVMTPTLLGEIADVEGQLVPRASGSDVLRVRVPLRNLEALADSPDVAFIAAPDEPQLATGGTNSEGDTTHRAGLARADFGVDGTGVTIGVLSDGVDSLATSQGAGELPTVTVLPGQAGAGDEGTAMLEIVHDIAPGAQLYFATAFNGAASFAQNIRDLRSAGCDIIVDDVFYYSEAAFQDDEIAQAVNDVTADGALYFSSAGNSGNLHDGTSGVWEGDADSWVAGTVGSLNYNFVDLDPGAGQQVENPVAYSGSNRAATLHWADPLGASGNDYDFFLVASDGTSIVASATAVQDGNDDPYERMDVPGGYSDRRILIGRYSGQPRFMHVSLNRGRFDSGGTGLTAYATAGMTTGHNSAANGFGVAAAPAHLAFAPGQPTGPYPGPFSGANVSETFTSDGPRRMFYTEDGTPYTPGNFTHTGGVVRQKPDITAADGVATTVPGFQPFYGTSAAAPHAAAIAGLVLDAHPAYGSAQVRAALTSTAIDIEGAGWDRDTGAGIVDAYAAVAYAPRAALSITAPASVNYNQYATISTRLTDASTHAGLPGAQVKLYKRANAAKPWSLVATRTTSATGRASKAVKMTANAQFQWRFAAAGGYPAKSSAIKSVAVKQVVSIARSAAKIKHGSTVKLYGTVKPTSAGQRVYLQLRQAGKWKSLGFARIKQQVLPNNRTATGYVFTVRLNTKGTFTFRVYKPATASLAAGYSATTSVQAT